MDHAPSGLEPRCSDTLLCQRNQRIFDFFERFERSAAIADEVLISLGLLDLDRSLQSSATKDRHIKRRAK